MNNGTIP